MAMEIQLINQIEQYEFLYNFKLPQYNRKDMVEEAWANIAVNTNMSISDCKEKWRNIRSSFLRSMKPSGHKVKKPYYLTDYLKFIVPFLKPLNCIESADESQYDSEQNTITNEAEMVVNFIKEEPTEGGNEENNENNTDNGIFNDILTHRSPVVRKRRRFVPTKKSYPESSRNRNKIAYNTFQRNLSNPLDTSNSMNSNNSAMRMFLMSLLPELETMTDQVRIFKIKTMMSIDEIKLDCTQVRQSTTSINTERLQKRLINLLLKNLQRTTNDNTKMKDS